MSPRPHASAPFLACLVTLAMVTAAAAQETAPVPDPDDDPVVILAQTPPAGPPPVTGAPPETAVAQVPPAATTLPPPQNTLQRLFGPTLVTGTADGYFEYNGNQPASGANVLRNFDEKDNQFSLSYVEVALEQTPTESRRFGFRADLGFGPTSKWVGSLDPDDGGLRYLQQGYASYLVPVGRGIQVDAGKFVTPIGAEPIETSGNWNYSRSLLFAWAAPYYHVGMRAAMPVHDKVTVTGFVVNGWNNTGENNRGKTIGASVSFTPVESLTLSQSWLGGPENPTGEPGWRHIVDTVATWDVLPRLSLMANVDIGRDQVLGQSVKWHGAAGYARFQVRPSWHVTPRLEWFEDAQGFATGTTQTLREVTLTSEHLLGQGLSLRLEYRRDWSSEDFFEYRTNQFRRSQNTVLFGLVYTLPEIQ